jgi:predicted HicB family RNase H-like nuclease
MDIENNCMYYKGYFTFVNYNKNDHILFGKIEEIKDLVNFEGKSVDELRAAFIEAVDDYLKTCKEIGKVTKNVF